MTRSEILDAYDVDANGLIRSPGKFESEALYVPHFWEYANDGEVLSWYDGSPDIYLLAIDADDRAAFPEIPADAVFIEMCEDDAGFVSAATLTQEERDTLVILNEQEVAPEDEESGCCH